MHTSPPSRPFRLLTTGKRAAVALLSLALVAGGALVATPASAAETGRISGVVTSLQTGEPLSDVEVAIYPAFDPLVPFEEPFDYDDTDAAGQYSFPRLPAGDYRIGFIDYSGWGWDDETDEEIAPTTSYLSQFHGGEPGDESGQVEPITVDGNSTVIDEKLSIAGKYTGKVLTPSGKPAAGVYVLAITENDDSVIGQFAETAKNGTFTIGGLAYGQATILTAPTDASPASVTAGVPLSADAPTAAVPAITLTKGAFLAGRLLDSTGKPLKNAAVGAESIDPDTDDYFGVELEYTNAKGEYTVGPVTAGTYAPFAYADAEDGSGKQYLGGSRDQYLARTVTLKAGVTTTREIRMATPATLTGVLLNSAGKRAAKIPVQAFQLDGTGEIWQYSGSTGHAVTNSRGEYTIRNLNPGSYLTEFGDFATAAGSPTTVDRALNAGTTTLNAKLSGVTLVSGTVTSSEGKALKGVSVKAVRVNPNSCVETLAVQSDEELPVTSATGTYSVAVPAGDWTLKFTDSTGRTVSGFLGGGSHIADPKTAIISTSTSNSTRTGQNVTLSTAGTKIGAFVQSTTGSPDVTGRVTVERVVEGEVVDGPYINECGTFASVEFDNYLNDQFPTNRLGDGDYRLTLEPDIWSSGFEATPTVVEFSIASNALTVVNGEPATEADSLGTITLAASVPAEPSEQIDLPTIFAPNGVTVGETLTAVTDYPGLEDEWSSYQWLRNGRPIAGATVENYVIQPGDFGALLTVQFAGFTTTGYIEPITSLPTAVVQNADLPVSEDAPTITGSSRIGGTLTAVPAPGDPKGTTYGYQWLINGWALPAVTSTTFTPRIQDLGETISVTITKTLPGADVTTGATSAGTVIGKGNAIVLSKPALLVNGKANTKLRLGSTLTASIKGMPKDGLGVSFQWQIHKGKSWSNLAGATTSTLTLSNKKSTTSNVGYTYRLVVAVERSGYEDSTPVTSNALKAHKK